MNLIQDKLTIVLAGAFNPAIFTPNWIAKNVLGYKADQQFQVEMLSPVAGIGAMPRFSFDGISYEPSFQKVTFFLSGLDETAQQRVTSAIATILGLLPHTPVAGLGFNFGFLVPEPGNELLDLLHASTSLSEALGPDAPIVSRSWVNVVSWHGALVSLQCQLDAIQVGIDANFHYGVTSAADAARVLEQPGSYANHMRAAIDAAKALTNQQLEEI